MAQVDEERLELEHEFLDSAKNFEWTKMNELLRATPDLINVQPCGRGTALHHAASSGDADVCKDLLKLGANLLALNHMSRTPADVAQSQAKEALEAAVRELEGSDVADAPAQPPRKKAKKATVYTMNINKAVDHEYETCSLKEIASAPTSALQGVASRGQEILKKFHVKTIRGLGHWKYYKIAKAITHLSELEQEGGRHDDAELNINSAMNKKHEEKSLKEIAQLPPSALYGIAEWADEELAKLHIKTIADLGTWKFAQWSEWIADLADFEE